MEVASLVIGFLLGLVPGWIARGRRLRGHWGALRAELELCADRGQALLTHHVGAPLYRFPTITYEASLPILLAEADVSEEEAMALGRFYCQVQDINRGLDNAAAFIMDTQRLEQEFSTRRCLWADGALPRSYGRNAHECRLELYRARPRLNTLRTYQNQPCLGGDRWTLFELLNYYECIIPVRGK